MVFPTQYTNISGTSGQAGGAARGISVDESSRGSGSTSPTGHTQPATTRLLFINNKRPSRDTPIPKFCSNEVSTTKYNALTFIPLFLFESFRRYSNAFFLFIAALQQIPDVSPTGRWTTLVPLSFILFVSACKEIYEDTKRRLADGDVNNRKVLSLQSVTFQLTPWKKIQVGEIVKVRNGEEFPSDLILLSSSEPQGICYIETSNLDGETNLKTRLALPETAQLQTEDDLLMLDGTIECESPNRHLYDFTGNIRPSGRHTIPLGPDQLLLRGSRLKNTEWIYGVVVFTGHDSKLMKNSKQGAILRLKRSALDEFANRQIIMMFALLIIVCLVSGIGNAIWRSTHESKDWYLFPLLDNQNFGFNFLTFIILYNNLIPISLQVTLEMVRFVQTLFVSWDLEMYDSTTNTPAVARTSNLNEDLGQIKYIFSDKTGTLTENNMIFRQCSIGGIVYGVANTHSETFSDTNMLASLRAHNAGSRIIHEFLLTISVCHTVVSEADPKNPFKPIYLAASPDESALVKAAASLDYTFMKRDTNHIIVRIRSNTSGAEAARYETLTYELLDILEFTSDRKRMSVIVRTPEGRILLMCKGADSVICDRLAPHQPYLDKTIQDLEDFAHKGFRTLCVATAEVMPEFYTEWKKQFVLAATALDKRKEKVADVCSVIERNLQLIGATAIEDRLQEGVPHCIAQLAKANIRVWILTGDKMETAINIGHACNLLNKNMLLFTLNETSLDRVREALSRFRNDLQDRAEPAAGLIVDGKALHYALSMDLRKEFLDIAVSCKAVICCRISPMQKADVVALVRTNKPKDVTLAIGDGANDVAMIQTAHVGVGISGKEGLQAVCASDYAIGQFRFLQKLLFVHGAWSYERISKLVLYCYHKNICLYIMQFYFAIISSFSGQTIFERWTIGLYNIFFTAAPPFVIGIFDKSCSAESRMRYPALYGPTQSGELFTYSVFWRWIFSALVHAAIIFGLTYGIFHHDVLWGDGQNSGGFLFGAAAFTYVVVVVCLKAGLETSSWTWITHVGIWGSIASWFIFLPIYSKLWPNFLTFGEDFVGIAAAMCSSWLFWMGLFLIPTATLLFDILFQAFRNTYKANVVDTVRRMEGLGVRDLDDFVNMVKPQPTAEYDTLLGTLSYPSPVHHPQQRGYAFSQDEGGAISQTAVVNLYGSTEATTPGASDPLSRLSPRTLQNVHPRVGINS